jgi:hypothetical protein
MRITDPQDLHDKVVSRMLQGKRKQLFIIHRRDVF